MSNSYISSAVPDPKTIHRMSPRELMQWGQSHDPFGHKVHMVMGTAWAMSIPFEMVPGLKDIMLSCLGGWVILRMIFGGVSNVWHHFYTERLTWAIGAWILWVLMSCAWSSAPIWGLEETGAMRSLLGIMLVYPLLHRLPFLLLGFAAGVLVINLVQISQVLGWIPSKKPPYRFAGGGSPNPLALCLAGAVTLNLIFALRSRTSLRMISWSAAASLAFVGILLTLNRGGVVAAAAGTISIAGIAVIVNQVKPSRLFSVVITGIVTLGILFGVDAVLANGRGFSSCQRLVATTTNDAINHSTIPVHQHSLGIRIAMWSASGSIWSSSPICGVGAGGMGAAVLAWPNLCHPNPIDQNGLPQAIPFHPHSTWMWMLASTGIIGFSIMLFTFVLAFGAMLTRIRSQPLILGSIGLLVAWCAGNVFDSLLLSGSTAAMLALSLCGAFAEGQGDPSS